jgi:hypothetical protein
MVWWCALASYVLLGYSMVQRDLRAHPFDQPFWAHSPSFGRALLLTLIWPYRSIAEARFDANPNRRVAFGLFGSALELASMTGILYLSFLVIDRISHDTIVRWFLAIPILFIAFVFIRPILNVLLIPVTLLLAFPLEWLFPMKDKVDTKSIAWCRNCKHFRKLKGYEDLIRGEWRATTMPPSDRLPCTATELTASTWAGYYALDPPKRTLFPNDCAYFTPKGR